MPRKPLIMTHEYPYHITARSNNKECFYLPQPVCWKIFEDLLETINIRFNFQIHAFVLMKNHYHLIASTSPNFPLAKVMEWFQRSANRKINDESGRINHVFGGPYKGSLITTDLYYYHAVRYLYQNPKDAGIVNRCENYRYSTINDSRIPLTSPISGIEKLVPTANDEFLKYLNKKYENESREIVKRALKRSVFRFPKQLRPEIQRDLGLRP